MAWCPQSGNHEITEPAMEPYIPQGDDEEEEWQRWKAKRARHREEKAMEEREIQKRLGESKGAAMNCLLVFLIAIAIVNFVIFRTVAGFVGGTANARQGRGRSILCRGSRPLHRGNEKVF